MPRLKTILKLNLTAILLFIALVSLGNVVKVIRVIDGDTFEIEGGEKVRMIGINAPERSDFFGIKSKSYLENLIEDKFVLLERDKFSRDRDRYNRLLRYIKVDNVDINKKMISDGYAFAYLKYKFTKSIDYKTAQLEAREKNLGIWGNSENYNIRNKNDDKTEPLVKGIPGVKLVLGLLLILVFLYILFRNKI